MAPKVRRRPQLAPVLPPRRHGLLRGGRAGRHFCGLQVAELLLLSMLSVAEERKSAMIFSNTKIIKYLSHFCVASSGIFTSQ